MEPMYYIGLDVHRQKISYCVKDSSGKIYAEGSIPATRFEAVSTLPSGLAVSITYNGASAPPSNAGRYAVAATVNDANYQGAGSATFTIKAAPLTITANDVTTILNAAMPSFTASYSGFVSGENGSALSGALNCTTTARATSAVGRYPITCGGQSSGNYAISYAPGTLRVLYAPAGKRAMELLATRSCRRSVKMARPSESKAARCPRSSGCATRTQIPWVRREWYRASASSRLPPGRTPRMWAMHQARPCRTRSTAGTR